MNSELHTFLRTRRSVRRFKADAIPISTIQRILQTATYAPSAHNLQPWRFVVLTNPKIKSRLSETITTRFQQDMVTDGISETEVNVRIERTTRRIQDTPALVILCHDSLQVNHQPDAIGQAAESVMGIQSVASAGLQFLLAAHAEGLGATWICWPLFAPKEVCAALDLPEEWEPQGMVFLGYPAESPNTPERVPLDSLVRWIL
jgi:F420 biosynthesis protein FbiB-like protein